MRAIIIADGDGKRWKNYLGVPKHLVKIDGEPILHRTVRLLKERGVADLHIVAPPNDERYLAAGGKLYLAKHSLSHWGDADKFLSSRELWNSQGRTVVFYGDCYFTEAAIDTILSYRKREWTLFARFGPHPYTGSRHSECFAQSFYPEHQAEHEDRLLYVAKLHRLRQIRRCGGWEHYHAMQGKTGRDVFLRDVAGAQNLGRAVNICDWSDDFDKPSQYQQFVAARETEPSPVNVLIPFRPDDKDPDGDRKAALAYVRERWKNEYPNFVIRQAACPPGPWRKGLAIMAAAGQIETMKEPGADPGIVIIADADVWTPGIERVVQLIRSGSAWVKPHHRFIRLTREATQEVLAGGDLSQLGSQRKNQEMRPYRQVACGGVVAMRGDVLRQVPPDPRFTGWGGEDSSWADALKLLVGRPKDGNLISYHLWHPPAVQGARSTTPRPNSPLRRRYKLARHNRSSMRQLIAEAQQEYEQQL